MVFIATFQIFNFTKLYVTILDRNKYQHNTLLFVGENKCFQWRIWDNFSKRSFDSNHAEDEAIKHMNLTTRRSVNFAQT